MNEREKLELGIYIMEKVTDYSYEDFDNIDEALNEILNNLKYELEMLDYREKRKKEEALGDREINRMKIRSLDELILSIPEEEIDDITKEFDELQEQYRNKFGELPPTAYVPYMTKEEIVETLRACIENNVKFLEFLHIGIDYNMLY